MQSEIAEAPGVFARTLANIPTLQINLSDITALYTIARGSSDAAANILSYEFMRELGLPMTSLPPSVFSLGKGVNLARSLVLIVSQSGASEDLVRSAQGARAAGAAVMAITNQPGSPVEQHAHVTLPIAAGPELAVPATKSVIGSVAAGLALLSALKPGYRAQPFPITPHPHAQTITTALTRATHVYIIGRDTGYGAAQELALKIKETCAIHAEAYSSSEVLHGPLQLATKPLLTLILDTGLADIQDSLDTAEHRFRATGGPVYRIKSTCANPAAAAAQLLCLTYPIVLDTALALGHDPDRPATLSKVTQTR